jgi:hypothetical protein
MGEYAIQKSDGSIDTLAPLPGRALPTSAKCDGANGNPDAGISEGTFG